MSSLGSLARRYNYPFYQVNFVSGHLITTCQALVRRDPAVLGGVAGRQRLLQLSHEPPGGRGQRYLGSQRNETFPQVRTYAYESTQAISAICFPLLIALEAQFFIGHRVPSETDIERSNC